MWTIVAALLLAQVIIRIVDRLFGGDATLRDLVLLLVAILIIVFTNVAPEPWLHHFTVR